MFAVLTMHSILLSVREIPIVSIGTLSGNHVKLVSLLSQLLFTKHLITFHWFIQSMHRFDINFTKQVLYPLPIVVTTFNANKVAIW